MWHIVAYVYVRAKLHQSNKTNFVTPIRPQVTTYESFEVLLCLVKNSTFRAEDAKEGVTSEAETWLSSWQYTRLISIEGSHLTEKLWKFGKNSRRNE